MNEKIVTHILGAIKNANDKGVILKALVKLRTDLVKDRDGIAMFRDCGGVPLMVRLLHKPHEKILEVALSILGNCCTDSKCCAKALESKLIPPLLTILKSVPNPTVQCRGCRLLGNLAKEDSSQLVCHSPALSQSLCLILEESIDEMQTAMMAVRAVKFLLNEKKFLEYFILHRGFHIMLGMFLKLIKNPNVSVEVEKKTDKPKGRKLSTHREEYFREVARHLEGCPKEVLEEEEPVRKSNQFILPKEKGALDIVSEILKCFQAISTTESHVPIMEIHATELGVQGIVFFAEENNPLRSTALKILSNFAKNPLSILTLNSVNVVSAACDLLTATNLATPLSEYEIRQCIIIISVLAGDACNRSKIRRSGALSDLISRAKVSTSSTELTLIIYAFNHFQYDTLSMLLMLQEGLIGILIKELSTYLSSTDKQKQEKSGDKKSIKRKITEDKEITSKQPRMWDELFEQDSPLNSPKTNRSQPSPCSSRSMSPVSSSSKYYFDTECEPENYSPVCSGDEDESGDELRDENSDIMKLLVVASQSDANENETMLDKEEDEDGSHDASNLNPVVETIPRKAIDIIDNLLLKISLLAEPRCELGYPRTIKTILEALNTFGNTNNFGNTLNNILMDIQHFTSIVKQNLIHSLYKMEKGQKLKLSSFPYLYTLTCVAESGYGRGELAGLLMRKELDYQKRAAIAISFIIKNPKFLYPLLTEYGALYFLINSILDKNDDYSLEAADGITSLSNCLGIKQCVSNRKSLCSEMQFDECTDFQLTFGSQDLDAESEAKFILHRGCSKIPIKFNKKLLADNSEVFNSMLNSSFKEGSENEVHLTNYSVHGIKYFLYCMYLMSKSENLIFPPVYYFTSLLESYELSIIYLLPELEKELFEMIVNQINSKTCLKILEWCLKNLNQKLSELTIDFYLGAELNNKEKVYIFREADYSSVSKEWNQMIIDTILVRCQNLMSETSLMPS